MTTETFLRGGQVTDEAGNVVFQTIYPGWYQGRTVHIHTKVHVSGQEVHTGQLYFDESLNSQVYATEPYSARPNRDTTNARDGIFGSGGSQSIINVASSADGYLGSITLGVKV